MAVENLGKVISLPVAADYSASQWRFMRINSSSQAVRAGDGEDADGVLQNDPAAAGRAGNIALGGLTKVEGGGTVTAGNYVSSDASGRAVNTVSGDYILGRSLTTATTAGEIISIILSPGHATF